VSKDEKKLLRKFFSKRIGKIQSVFEKRVEDIDVGDARLDLDDIDEELDEALSKIRDLAGELMDDTDYAGYGYSYGSKTTYGSLYDYRDYEDDNRWPKRGSSYVRKDDKTDDKDFSKDLKEVKSDKCLTLKFDAESFGSFLSESDGKLENIAVITADNREYSGIENTLFKIKLIPPEFKLRRGAYTEANGKEISDTLAKINGTKCGWIHTHPFGRGATFFSGTDDSTTKEMCVLPDDYCIAIVVACSYNEVSNHMTEIGRVIKEYELSFDIGKMVYRKTEIPKFEYDPKTDTLKNANELILTKYDCSVVLVDKNGNEVPMPKPDPTKYNDTTDSKKDDLEEPSYENQQFCD
jgi:hypothetical protein